MGCAEAEAAGQGERSSSIKSEAESADSLCQATKSVWCASGEGAEVHRDQAPEDHHDAQEVPRSNVRNQVLSESTKKFCKHQHQTDSGHPKEHHFYDDANGKTIEKQSS